MSISSVSSNAPVYQPPQNNVRQNFQQLSQALQSGDISSAQQAYASLIQALPNQGGNGADGKAGQNNPFQQALQSIGSALQSGDIAGAQQALQTLQTQMKSHHGHHHGQTQQTTASTSTSSPPTDNDGDNDSSVGAATSLNLFA